MTMDEPDLSLLLSQSARAVSADPQEAKKRFREASVRAAPVKRAACEACGVKHRDRTADQCRDREMLEATLRARVTDRAERRKWRVAHAGVSMVGPEARFVTQMMKSWPDLTLIKEGHRLIFMELKREEGDYEEGQLELLQLLNTTGNRAIVVRPSDLREGRVSAILQHGAPI
jgi:hypothetical protein